LTFCASAWTAPASGAPGGGTDAGDEGRVTSLRSLMEAGSRHFEMERGRLNGSSYHALGWPLNFPSFLAI
ncbi:hypothetical protein D7Y23_37395, partial [Corallococcus sp. AB050B]